MNPIPITQKELKQGFLARRFPLGTWTYEGEQDGIPFFSSDKVIGNSPIYQVGDMIPALEEWATGSRWCHSEYKYYEWIDFRYDAADHLKEHAEWQPAETCPLSRYDLRVTEVDCKKLGKCTFGDLGLSGLNSEVLKGNMIARYREDWNKLHPDHPFSPDLYSFGVKFEIVKKEAEHEIIQYY